MKALLDEVTVRAGETATVPLKVNGLYDKQHSNVRIYNENVSTGCPVETVVTESDWNKMQRAPLIDPELLFLAMVIALVFLIGRRKRY
jgi:hypothetical protein